MPNPNPAAHHSSLSIGHWSLSIGHWSLVILLAWTLLLYRLGAQSFWYDEGYAVYTASLAPANILLWSSRDFVPPLHPYLLALWLSLAGWTEFAARFLSVWAGTLMAAGMIRLGRDLYSRPAGFLAGLLAAISPFYVWYGQETRAYTYQALFGLLATLLLVRALKQPQRWRLWAGLALLDALALYSQATSGFLLLFHGLVILISGWGKAGRMWLIRGGLAL
ncbi:MAG: glycosyltransferase family 39 protein, partial [Chloroflexota bacterium]|nr:glycosyltransferase family 39 protein [Chloroflexota bacterium]